jgi:hypothetical protein
MPKTAMQRFLKDYPAALSDGVGALFIGAGVSMSAGYPSWGALLQEIGDELGVGSSDVHDLAALAQWSIQESGGATRVRNVIKEQIGIDHPIPDALETISRLPIRHIWTTNYDRLIERSFASISRPLDVIAGASDLSLRAKQGATRLYKMHGSIDRLDDIVISTDDYELFRKRRGAYLPLLQAHLSSMSMLFIGLSFSDPNIKHVLSLIRESFTDAPPEHFAIVRPPKREDFKTDEEFSARSTQHTLWSKDLRRYGLIAIEIDNYSEVPTILLQIERRVAARRIWVSGSWPVEGGGSEAGKLYSLSEHIGHWIGKSGHDLVSGAGMLVGSGAISGFLDSLRSSGGWDLDRRLVVRPFPQPLVDKPPSKTQWTALRTELARHAGIAIFIGGAKTELGHLITADGVLEEFELAKDAGAFLIPVAATGGAAQVIYDKLLGSSLPTTGEQAARPTDEELRSLASPAFDVEAIVKTISSVVRRVLKA